MPELNVSLSSATAAVLEHTFAEAKERGDELAKYARSIESFAENLFDYAIKRRRSEWKSRDAYNVGKVLREALDKMLNGKPLSAEETKLVAEFRTASAPTEPVATKK